MRSKLLAGGLILGMGFLLATNPVVADAAALITGKDIKNESVTTKDIKNRSLLAKDFRAGQLPAGPQGPQGPTGATGSAGPGTLLATDSVSSNLPLAGTCSTYPGAEVSITVPSAGYVVVHAQVHLRLSHTSGTRDVLFMGIGATTNYCPTTPDMGLLEVPAELPTHLSYENRTVRRAIHVPSGGTYTYHLNGEVLSGLDANDIWQMADLTAVFYPD